MKLFKKNESKETVKLPMSGKVKKGFRFYCVAVMATALVACPIGLKSKSKSLFLSSISSPPYSLKTLPLYFTEIRFLMERCLISYNKVFNLLL